MNARQPAAKPACAGSRDGVLKVLPLTLNPIVAPLRAPNLKSKIQNLKSPCYAIILAHMCYEVDAMSTTIIMEPDIQQKLAILGSEAADEVTDVPATERIQQGITHATGLIYNAKQAGGGTSRLFKVLQTNACRYTCRY